MSMLLLFILLPLQEYNNIFFTIRGVFFFVICLFTWD